MLLKTLSVLGIGLSLLLSGTMPWKSTYKRKDFSLKGHRALVVATGHSTLDSINPTTGETLVGKPTGVYASELTDPYYEFLDSGMEVDIATVKGGEVPIDPLSLKWIIRTHYDDRLLADSSLQERLHHAHSLKDIDVEKYDVIMLVGGWGAAYDLGQSQELGELVTKAYAKGLIIGSVCHGALGLINAKDEQGRWLIEGKRVTGVTNKQLKELGVTVTPLHPETELRKRGAIFESSSSVRDFFANHVVRDGRLVTAQNQKGGVEAAQKIMEMLSLER